VFFNKQPLKLGVSYFAGAPASSLERLVTGCRGEANAQIEGWQNLDPGVPIGLDGKGDPNSAWIFQVGSALTTAAGAPGAPGSQVLLIGGAQAKNVVWQLGSSGTLGTYSLFQGTIMAQASITLGTGATLNGRALARTGAVTLDSNPVNVPPCP